MLSSAFMNFLHHQYTLSLLFWIVPGVAILATHHWHRALSGIAGKAFLINLAILAGIGFVLDLLFAHHFFRFPNPDMVLGIFIRDIPIEEFLFYILGFWFILLLYLFNDEFFLSRYNVDKLKYRRFARRLKRSLILHVTKDSIAVFVGLVAIIFAIKWIRSTDKAFYLPGYALFLAVSAYVPFIFFWRITRYFVNFRALVFTVIITTLISIIWEVTLALPRGYWSYNPDYMLGIFISFWHNLPIEAVTVWIFSSLIILTFEYTKILLHRKAKHPLTVNVEEKF